MDTKEMDGMSQEEFYVWYVFHVVHVDGLLEVLSLLLSIDIISTAGFYMAPFVHCRCSLPSRGRRSFPLSLSLSVSAALFRTSPNTETHTQASWENIGCHGERGGSSTVEWCIHYSTCFLIHTHTHTHTRRDTEMRRIFSTAVASDSFVFSKKDSAEISNL